MKQKERPQIESAVPVFDIPEEYGAGNNPGELQQFFSESGKQEVSPNADLENGRDGENLSGAAQIEANNAPGLSGRHSIRCKGYKIKKKVNGKALENILARKLEPMMSAAIPPKYGQGDTAPLINEQCLALLCRKTGEVIDVFESLKVGSNAAFADYVPIDNPTVSKKHAVFTKKNNLLFLEDLGSSNGTKINGVRLPKGIIAEIKEGDTVTLSNEVFIVQRQ